MNETARGVVMAFVGAINRGDASEVAALMTEDHTFVDATGEVTSGREAMKAGWAEFFQKCPDYEIRVDEMFADGPRIAVFGSVRGTYNGRRGMVPENRFAMPAAWKAVVAGNRVAHWQVYADWTEAWRIVEEDGRAGTDGPGRSRRRS